MTSSRATALLVLSSILVSGCRLRSKDASGDEPRVYDPADGGAPADFVLDGANFSFHGRSLPFCHPPSEWTAVLGPSKRSDADAERWSSPYHMTCRKTPGTGAFISSCAIFYHNDDDGVLQSSLSISVDGAWIGPDTKATELNYNKRGTRFRASWTRLIWETRREDNDDPYFVEVTFAKAKGLTIVSISTHGLHCGDDGPPYSDEELREVREFNRVADMPPGPEKEKALRALSEATERRPALPASPRHEEGPARKPAASSRNSETTK